MNISTHVLKHKGTTIAEVDEYDHASGILFGRAYRDIAFAPFLMAELEIVPRAELLAGQIQVA